MTQPAESNRPYADFVESTSGKTQSWLVEFLRQGYRYRRWSWPEPYIDIYILDSIDGSLASQHFRPHHLDEVSSQFQTALTSRPLESNSRILLIQGGQLCDMNVAHLDAIGWHFRLDPSFFCAYAQAALYLSEDHLSSGPTQLPVSLPSENNFITFATNTVHSSYAIASIDVTDDMNTIIMLGFDASGHRIKDLQSHLTIQPREVIKAADNHPSDFLLFYIQEYLRNSAKQSQNHGHLQPAGPFVWPRSPRTWNWEENQSNLRNLLRSRSALSRHINANYPESEGSRPLLASTLKDYDYLIDETRENAAQLQSLLQNYTSLQAIKESQKGLEQADVVRKFTLVGIVFIPLSFATSFFGMNLEQLGTGTLHIGYFVLLAVLSGLVAWLLAASIGTAERMWGRAQNRLGDSDIGVGGGYEWVTTTTMIRSWIVGCLHWMISFMRGNARK